MHRMQNMVPGVSVPETGHFQHLHLRGKLYVLYEEM